MKKKRILMAFVMLLLSGVALTTASYAWFTANTRITLGQIDVNVTAANGIQVSVDATNWKATLTTDEIKAATYTDGGTFHSSNQFPTTLEPVSTTGSLSKGIFDMFYGKLNADSTINLTKEVDAQGTTGKYVAFDLFVQTTGDTAKNIKLLNSSSVAAASVAGATLSDKGLKYSARVGFLNKGTDATATPKTAMALDLSSGYSIWEPNADQHTAIAINSGGAVAGTPLSYLGAKAIGTNITANNAANFGAVTTIKSNVDQSTLFPTDTVFSLTAGISKIRIYIWLEGQDIDCENSASLGSGISIKLNLNAE